MAQVPNKNKYLLYHVSLHTFLTVIAFLTVHVFVLQVFLIIHYQPMVNALADVILNGDLSVFPPQTDIHSTHKTVTHSQGN